MKISERKKSSQFLRAEDVPAEGAFVTVTEVAEVELSGDTKVQVTFAGELNGSAILGVQALETIAAVLGDETDEWAGGELVAFRDVSVMYQGRRVGGIRFRSPDVAPAMPAAKPAAKPADKPAARHAAKPRREDDIPF